MWSVFRKKELVTTPAAAAERIKESLQPGDFTLGNHYPTPASGHAIIPLSLSMESSVRLVVSDGQGMKQLQSDDEILSSGAATILLQLQHLKPGIYTCSAIAENDSGGFQHSILLTVK